MSSSALGVSSIPMGMTYTSQTPVLDLTGKHIKTKEDIEAAFHALHLCPEEEEQKSNGRKERRTSKSK